MRRLQLLLIALVTLSRTAAADDALEPVTDSRVLLAETWSLTAESRSVCTGGEMHVQDTWTLSVTRGGSTHAIPVNLLWLADRIDSNLICTGSHAAGMDR